MGTFSSTMRQTMYLVNPTGYDESAGARGDLDYDGMPTKPFRCRAEPTANETVLVDGKEHAVQFTVSTYEPLMRGQRVFPSGVSRATLNNSFRVLDVKASPDLLSSETLYEVKVG